MDDDYELMMDLYPKLPFSIDFDEPHNLEDELLPSKIAIIHYPLKCICCCPEREGCEVILIQREQNIKYKDLYQECNDQWKNKMCNHSFLEDITIKNNIQINLGFGS